MRSRITLGLLVLFAPGLGAAPALSAGAAQPTVVELFTSQGCSSCPPANAAVAAVADRRDVLALSFGVTYWDRLGWKDTFGHPAFTERQWAYARRFKREQVYTPQVVVNGRMHSVGNSRPLLERLIRDNERKRSIPLRLANGRVSVASPGTQAGSDVWMVRYDPRTIQVPVRRGENGGKTLPHRNVVHELVRLGGWTGGNADYALPAPTRSGLRTAVLLQDRTTGAILGAAKE